MHDDQSKGASRVGYKNPPKETRFQKGRSGNKKGRPPASRNADEIFDRILKTPIEVTAPTGRSKRMTKLELAVRQFVDSALAGDMQAIRKILPLARQIAESDALHRGIRVQVILLGCDGETK